MLMGGAFVVLIAALLVPAALGAVRPDDRAGVRGAGAAVVAQAVRPDDRAGPRGAGAAVVAQAVRPDDRTGARGPGAVTQTPTPAAEPTVESGYDWGRIVLVIAIVAGVALVATALTLTLRQHRGPGRPVPH
jgi:hypothetical protein